MRVHRFAIATAVATFALLIFGGLVSTTESGLACPDWPLCEGQWIPRMIDGKEYEHTHRLVASFVGAMTFGLAALLWKHRRKDRLLTRLGALAALGVTIQALLGALTVKLKLPWWVSSTHLAVAMAFFGVAVTLACLTRQRLSQHAGVADPRAPGRVLLVGGLVYAQLVVGGLMRHLRGGLACGYEILTCQGQVWPLEGHAGVHLHMAHRLLGLAAGFALVWLGVWLVRTQTSRAVRWLGLALAAGVVVQVGLGIATVLASRELWTMSFHSSVGAALWAGTVALYWLVRPVAPFREEPSPRPAPAEARAEPA